MTETEAVIACFPDRRPRIQVRTNNVNPIMMNLVTCELCGVLVHADELAFPKPDPRAIHASWHARGCCDA
jgi:hypothetical protein